MRPLHLYIDFTTHVAQDLIERLRKAGYSVNVKFSGDSPTVIYGIAYLSGWADVERYLL